MSGLLRAEYYVPVFGALCMIASWIGWGTLLQRALRLNAGCTIGWSTRAGWGMAVLLAMGGIAMVFRLAGPVMLMGYTAIGAILCLMDFLKVYRSSKGTSLVKPHDAREWILLAPVIGILIIYLLGSIETNITLASDDCIAYMVFTKRILQTGTMIEPYSFRRLSTYGGQQLVHAQQYLFAPYGWNLSILEWGIMPILIVGQIWEFMRPRTFFQRALACVVVLAALLFSIPHPNSQSQSTGIFMFMVLFRTMWIPGRHRAGIINAAMVGLVAAALATFRINLAPVALLLVVGGYLWAALRSPTERGRWLGQGAIALASMLVFLAGWALVLYESSRSLFFPLMKGNMRPDFDVFDNGGTLWEKTRIVISFLAEWRVLTFFTALAIAFIYPARRRMGLNAVIVAVMALALVYSFTRAEPDGIHRYIMTSLFAVVFTAAALVLRRTLSRPVIGITLALLALLVACNSPASNLIYTSKALYYSATSPLQIFMPRWIHPRSALLYQEAQEKVPPGAQALVACSAPQFLDYARNPLWNIDIPGAAGPDPGLPIKEGGSALKKYLLDHDIHYIILVDPDSDREFFAPSAWVHPIFQKYSVFAQLEILFRAYAKTIYQLIASEEVIFTEDHICVLRLRAEQ